MVYWFFFWSTKRATYFASHWYGSVPPLTATVSVKTAPRLRTHDFFFQINWNTRFFKMFRITQKELWLLNWSLELSHERHHSDWKQVFYLYQTQTIYYSIQMTEVIEQINERMAYVRNFGHPVATYVFLKILAHPISRISPFFRFLPRASTSPRRKMRILSASKWWKYPAQPPIFPLHPLILWEISFYPWPSRSIGKSIAGFGSENEGLGDSNP